MRVLITGIDGYLGFPLALSLGAKGHEVAGIDNELRRKLVKSEGSQSAIPIEMLWHRQNSYEKIFGKPLVVHGGDLAADNLEILDFIKRFNPDAIVYLGEIPSAPYSMKGRDGAIHTQYNNVLGTLNTLFAMQEVCPDAHLIKLGTLGEYGTPDCDIPEGHFPTGSQLHNSKSLGSGDWVADISGMTFPKRANSWYHLSKVHDSNNIEFACRNWGLRSTDIMQGVVYGTRTDEMNWKTIDRSIAHKMQMDEAPPFLDSTPNENVRTRFDFDECFGTAINRFCAQAVAGLPITVYGEGKQKRGFLPLRDSIQCMNLALENPPEKGEYRVFNQFEEVYSIEQLAKIVRIIYNSEEWIGNIDNTFPAKIVHLENPRNEAAEHYYNPVHQKLFDLGYKPTNDLRGQIKEMIEDLIPHRQRILDCKDVLMPKIGWDGKIEERKEL